MENKNEWKKVKLEEIVTITMGQSPKSEFYNSSGKGMPFLQGNRTFGRIFPFFDTYTTKITKIAQKNDIIMSVRAPIGDLNIATENICLGRGVCSLKMNNGNYSFLFYLMKHYSSQLINRGNGTVFTSINKSEISNLNIYIPTNEIIQKKIAKILSDIDERIELNNKINDNLEKQAQLIFKSWFVDFEPFKDLEVLNWKKDILGNLVTIRRGSSPRPIQNYLSKNGFNWLKISDVSNLTSPFVFETQEKIKEEGLKKTVLLSSGDLVVSNSATPGIPKILNTPCCIHDGWLYFTNSIFSNEFLYLFFKYKKNKLVTFGNGSVFTNLKTDILKNIEILIPPKEILNEFNKIIKPIFKMILSSSQEVNKLTTLKYCLLAKLMNGEIDVKNIEL